MFDIVFYLFSALLAYMDWKYLLVPNQIMWAFLSLLLLFGWFEGQLSIVAFGIAFLVLVFFIGMILLRPKMVLGGGDIKYMMVVGLYIEPLLFPFFLIITGVVQTLFLIFYQRVKQHKKVAMVPAMFLSVIISQYFAMTDFFPFF